MPWGEGAAPRPRCARHARLDFQVKPRAKSTRETQSFVTQMYLTINFASWEKTACFGVSQKRWSTDSGRTCAGLQQESAGGGAASSTQESLSSQNTVLISPVIISQMIDGNKSKGNQPALPMQSTIPQPSPCHTKQSLSNHGSLKVTRAFLVLPSRLEVQASSEDTKSPSDSQVTGEKQCPKQQNGFASITVTARRVAVGSGDPGAVQDPSTVSPTSSRVPAVLPQWPPPGHTPQRASPGKVSGSCPKSGEEPRKQLFDPGLKETGVGLQSSDGREEAPPSFLSCVHLQVSQRCPRTIYYLDKSLNVCIDQPRIKCQKTYRSTLSFDIKCSLSRLTADGVDGIANGEPMEETAPTKLPGANRTPLRSELSADFTENKVINKVETKEGCLGSKYPLQSVLISELPAFVDIPRGHHNVVATKKEEDEHSGSSHTLFSLQLPNSSDKPGTQMLLGRRKRSFILPDAASREAITAAGSSKRRDPSKDTSKSKEIQAQGVLKPKLSVSNCMCNTKTSSRILSEENAHRQNQLLKSDSEFRGSGDRIKELKDELERARRVTLSTAHWPGVTWEENNVLTWPGTGSQPEEIPAAPWTLQEALEIHNPRFISRSQERLRRLEHMVQLRKAQQSDSPVGSPGALVRKLSSTSTSSRRKHYTIPDPLSDNLFKPKERFIPEKEMHMRSKRIYENLPEVKKKQEEKQKRIIMQSNRLRVEMFKKQLLDQLLHRNTE
ncbi:(E2-independent) E3 ubiquitin-conjugating enzyme FATS isoform X1 [Empidonax traillii]|uniref:(E2-independent) E3 ubiquitin-conjugating enzyme FATS isoform X1 n=1 Tax=Empidonax traillii TaxID=164674 RepID=UPI000FFD46FD|nr:(E2-independent) E3 ubiquitin-conjugating enzyme FATS isoform X1 [Empidonax traillii]